MPVIKIDTEIHSPIERVFDLSRSIDAHMASTAKTGELAVGGCTSGLIGLGEVVTWEARHFGVKQRLTVKVTRLERPFLFEDEMVSGAFQRMHHQHRFEEKGLTTVMKDSFDFRAPLGLIGRLAEKAFLTRYMKHFLTLRACALKEMAESDQWKTYLHADTGYTSAERGEKG